MSVTPAGPFSLVFAKAAELLAASSNFRAMVEADDATDALERIFYPGCQSEQGPPVPGAVLYKYPGLTRQKRSRQGAESGSLLLTLYGALPDPRCEDVREELLEWSNVAGLVTLDMLELSRCPIEGGADFYWGLTEVEEIETDWLYQEQTDIDVCRVSTLLLTWT